METGIQARGRDDYCEKGQRQMARHITKVVSPVMNHCEQHILYIYVQCVGHYWTSGSLRAVCGSGA